MKNEIIKFCYYSGMGERSFMSTNYSTAISKEVGPSSIVYIIEVKAVV